MWDGILSPGIPWIGRRLGIWLPPKPIIGPKPPRNTAAPTITGATTTGETLTGAVGTWAGDATITYAVQWTRDGVDIAGATATTYTLVTADEGTTPGFRVTATNAAGSASVTVTAGAPVQAPFDPAPADPVTTVEFLRQTFDGVDNTLVQTLPNMVKHPLAANDAVITSNRARASGTSGGAQALYYDSTVPPSADYDVTATLFLRSDNNSSSAGPMARLDSAAWSGYQARYNTTNDSVELLRFNAGAQSILAAVAMAIPTDLTIRCVGDQLTVLADGVIVIDPVTDATFTAAGFAGFRCAGSIAATTGVHIDTLTAAAAEVATTPPPPADAPGFAYQTFDAADNTPVESLTGMAKHPLATNDAVVTANRARATGSSAGAQALYYDTDVPSSPDYEVTTTLTLLTDNNSGAAGPFARMDPVDFSGYWARWNSANDSVELYRFTKGSQSLLGSALHAIPTDLTIRCAGNQITALADGVEVVGPVTDETHAGPGYAGFRFTGAPGATTGVHIETFSAQTMQFVYQTFDGVADETLVQAVPGMVKHPLSNADAMVDAGRARSAGAIGAQAVYFDSTVPPTADYGVTATMALVTDNNSSSGGPLARFDPAAISGYWARYDTADDSVKLHRLSGTSTVNLGTAVAMPCPAELTLQCIGDQISVIADGTRVIGPITDGTIAATGRAGFRFTGTSGAAVGVQIDMLTATGTPTPAPVVTPPPTPPPDPAPVTIAYPRDFNDGILPGTNWPGAQFGASNTDAGVPAVSLIDPTDTTLGMPANPPAYATKILQLIAGPDPLRAGGSARAEVAQVMSTPSGGVPPYVDANGIEYYTPEWMSDRTKAVPSSYFMDGCMQNGEPVERWSYWAIALPADPAYRPGVNYILMDQHGKLGVNFLMRIHNADPDTLQVVIRGGRFEAQVDNAKPAWAVSGPDATGFWGLYAVAGYDGTYDSTRRAGEWPNQQWDFVNHVPIRSSGTLKNGVPKTTYSQAYQRFFSVLNPIPWGTWMTVEHRKVWSNDARGGHQLWINGNLVLDAMGIPTLYKWSNELKVGDVKVGYPTNTDPDQQNRAADYFATYEQLQNYSGGTASVGSAKRAWYAPYGVHTSRLTTPPW